MLRRSAASGFISTVGTLSNIIVGTLSRREDGPAGQVRMIGIPGARKVDPRISHFRRQCACVGSASGHVFAPVGVIKHKCDLRAVKGARSAIENGCLPGKPIKIGRCPAERGFRRGLFDRRSRAPRMRRFATTDRTAMACGVRARKAARTCGRLVSEEPFDALLEIRVGHEFIFGMIDRGDKLVERACR